MNASPLPQVEGVSPGTPASGPRTPRCLTDSRTVAAVPARVAVPSLALAREAPPRAETGSSGGERGTGGIADTRGRHRPLHSALLLLLCVVVTITWNGTKQWRNILSHSVPGFSNHPSVWRSQHKSMTNDLAPVFLVLSTACVAK